MINSYLTIIYRNLFRQFSYSFINIAGLAIGLSCSLVIFLYVYGEWTYDRGFTNGDRVYRIGISFFNMGKFANGPEALLTYLPKEFDGIESATRIQKDREVPVRVKEKSFTEPTLFYADSAFFHVFGFNFVQGNSRSALRGRNEAVVTEKLAAKYFGKTNVLGEVMEIGKEKTPYTIVGIVETPASNTHLKTDLWVSNQTQLKGEPAWTSAAFYSYVLLRPNSTEANLHQALDKTMENHVYPEAGIPMGFKTLADYKANENSVKFNVYRLQDIYLKSKLSLELYPGGNETNIYVFSAISLFILVLAGVNFVNLTTARASRRAKEVGIRKTLGTSRRKLIGQFLLESVFISTIAMGLALVLAEIFLALFEYIAGDSLVSSVWTSPSSIAFYFGVSILVGILSGIYPAFYLTSFSPARVLKGNVALSGGGFRNLLVVFQFTVSITLIICTTVVLQQLQFIKTKDLGFDQQNAVTVDNGELLGTSAELFKNELTREAGVMNSSFHGGEPGSKRILSFYTYRTAAMENELTINTYFGDADYVPLMGYQVVKGRPFSRDLASDTAGIILNESAVSALGLGDQPIGAVINKNQHVIGVVRDFHWESLRNSIAPTAIILSKQNWQIGFRLSENSIPGFLKKAEARWKQLVPDEPFRYHFLDENFGQMLEKERIFGKAISFFTALAIFISCLGLYGLAAFTAEQRTKEIGIRKVLGASAANIVVLLNKKFTRLVVIAIIIALPASIYAIGLWLEGFAYKVPLQAGGFVMSIAGALLIAWLTVSFHSLRAAIVNPSETLKYE